MSTTAPAERPSTAADRRGEDVIEDEPADATWAPPPHRPHGDWAISPAMQQKVRELCGTRRHAPPPSPRQTLGPFEAGERVVWQGVHTVSAGEKVRVVAPLHPEDFAS